MWLDQIEVNINKIEEVWKGETTHQKIYGQGMLHSLCTLDIERWWSAQGRSSQEGKEGSCRITSVCCKLLIY